MSSFYRPGYSEKDSGVNRHDFDFEDDDDEDTNTPQRQGQPGNDKIKFKKKRKKPKLGLVSVYKDMTYKSRFDVGINLRLLFW